MALRAVKGGQGRVRTGVRGAGGAGSAVSLPAPVGFIGLGDSRIANGMGFGTVSNAYALSVPTGNGYPGWLIPGIGNKVLLSDHAGVGIGSSTTSSLPSRANSPNNYDGKSFVQAYSGTGNGTLAAYTGLGGLPGSATQAGVYVITMTAATTFTVTDPLGATVGTGTTGTNFLSTQINFKITVGATPFIAGDHFNVTLYGPQNPGFAATGGVTDMQWSTNSTGEYSTVTAPDNIIFLMDGVNDSLGVATSITNITTTLNLLASKVVFLANETPLSVGYAQLESHAVSANACTATHNGVGTFLNDGADFGSTGVINGGTGAIYAKVASAPAIGQYAVSSAGVYSFNASDTIATAVLHYSYRNLGPTGQNRLDLHYWLSSNAANFVANGTGGSGTNYGVPGALYGRSNVISVDTWGALIDPATVSGSPSVVGSYANLPGTLTDGLHPCTYGGQLVRNAFVTAFNTAYAGRTLPDLSQTPTTNNYWFATGNASNKTFTTTWPNATSGAIAPLSLTVRGGTVTGTDDGAGNITGSGITGTVNYATGAISVTFTVAVANGTHVVAYTDPTNLFANGMFDPAMTLGGGAVPTNVTGISTLPGGWTMTVDANTATGLAAGTITLAVTNTTSDAGYPELTFTVAGHATTSGVITLNGSINSYLNIINTATPDKLRAGLVTKTLPNGGHLYGLQGAFVKNFIGTSGGVTRPAGSPTATGVATTFTSLTATSLTSSGTLPYSDLDLTPPGQATGFTVSAITPSQSTNGLTSLIPSITMNWTAGPVSGIWKVSQAQARIRPD